MRIHDTGTQVVGFVLTVIAIIVVSVVAIRDCRRQEECVDRGGRIERYNHRTIYVTRSCGSGCTVVVPEEVSDWRCVGGRAEAE